MAIRTVVTAGFGNGTFNGTIPLVVTRGYIAGATVGPSTPGLEYTMVTRLMQITMNSRLMQSTLPPRRMQYTMKDREP